MRITLVHPAGFNFVPGQPDITQLANRMAPIGILSLAAWLEKHGHDAAVHDCLGPRAPRGIEASAEAILATAPDLVGFSATTAGFMDAADIAAHIKTRRPETKILLGNVHASAIGPTLLKHFPEIDYLCIGEGEGLMLDLAEGRPLREIANLAYRDPSAPATAPATANAPTPATGGAAAPAADAGIVFNNRRARIQDLDTLPFPAYAKLDGFPSGYHLPLFSYIKRWGATMITSRGCPYTCSFCDRTVFERLHRYNSAAYIYEHMRHLRDHFGVRHINIYDDLFTAHKKRVHELCELLIRKPLGVGFNCAIRTGHDDLEMLKLLKRAGALMVSLGVESADPEMMRRHKAGVTLEAVRETVEKIHAAGLRAKGLFIFGLPGETPGTVRATSDFILSLDLDEMNLTKFSPLYGAPVWDECASQREGAFTEDWRLLNCLNFTFIPKGFPDREEMDALYNWHIQRYYNSNPYRRRFAKNLWQHRWSLWHLAANLPATVKAARYFHANRSRLEAMKKDFPLHPRQPRNLQSPEQSARP